MGIYILINILIYIHIGILYERMNNDTVFFCKISLGKQAVH